MPAFAGAFAALHGTDHVEVMLPKSETMIDAGMRLVSAEYFEVLGVRPALGRLLVPADHLRAASEPGLVISHRFWTSRLNQHPAITGKTLTIGRQPFTVLGVAPPEFFGEAAGQAPDLWAPLAAQPLLSRGVSLLTKANVGWLKVMARIKPGADEESARAAMSVFLEQLKAEPGRVAESVRNIRRFELSPGMRGLEDLRQTYSLPLQILMVIVGVVLLIACANVAGLLLARGAQRQREIAIRLALGAKRSRIVRQLMTESVCIAAGGAALGILFAIWTTRSLLLLASQGPEPMPLQAGVDARVLLFTVVVSMVSSILCGLIPAIQATRGHQSLTIKTRAHPRHPLRRALVVAQVAMSVVLVAAAGLFLRTLHNLRTQDIGFLPAGLLQVRVDPQASGYPSSELPGLADRVLNAVRAVPGVVSASMSHSGFNTGMSRTCCIAVEGYTFAAGENRQVRTNSVMPDYFDTIRLPLLVGRKFTATDVADPPRVAILSESAVRHYFGARSPIGSRMGWGDGPGVRYGIEIVGVVEDAKTGNLRDGMQPILYFPAHDGRVIHVRSRMDAAEAAAMIRQAIQRTDRNLPVRGIHAVTTIIDSTLVVEKLMGTLAGFFGVLALCLAAVGLYGTIDYSVRRRTHEIGLRMAIGARPTAVVALISREAAILVAAGIGIGVLVFPAASRLLTSMLFGIDAADPVNIVVAATVLAVTGALAAMIPSSRAASVNPLTALRHD